MPEETEFPRTIKVIIEIPLGSFVKRQGTGIDARVEFVSPLPAPFNYGYVSDLEGGDKAPLDALVLGSRISVGSVVEMPVR